jgi:hypothetical protein
MHDLACIQKNKKNKKNLTNRLVIIYQLQPQLILLPKASETENSKFSRAIFRASQTA